MADEGPSSAIEGVAQRALANDGFRLEAEQPDNFEAALLKEYGGVSPLTDEEERFCRGWLYLARLQFSGSPEEFDLFVVAAVNASMVASAAPRSG